MLAAEVHRSVLIVLAFSTAHVMTVDELKARVHDGFVGQGAGGQSNNPSLNSGVGSV